MKFLVTGAAGFIGSSVVDRLLSLGHEVVGVDNFSTGHKEFMESALACANYRFIEGDLMMPALLDSVMMGVEHVFHLAANADIRGGLTDPKRDLEQNTFVTFLVLESMRRSGVKRITFSSSAAALGEPEVFPTPENCAVPIQTSLYGASKMACEGLISAYCEGFGFEGYVFRFVSLLGPRYPHGHVYDFVQALLQDPTRLHILGDGQQRKSYLHIEDCVNALVHITVHRRTALENRRSFEVYHLGMTEYCRVRESAEWICSELGVTPLFDFAGGDRGWIGDNPFVFLDASKAMGVGWSPRRRIEESVRETARWLVRNTWVFRK
jgi:UDP-glucose 4-epimerase